MPAHNGSQAVFRALLQARKQGTDRCPGTDCYTLEALYVDGRNKDLCAGRTLSPRAIRSAHTSARKRGEVEAVGFVRRRYGLKAGGPKWIVEYRVTIGWEKPKKPRRKSVVELQQAPYLRWTCK